MSQINHSVTVVGSTNWDICMYLSELPKPGQTLGDGRLQTNIGGKGANQAVASHMAGAETNFISCLGDDDSGQRINDYFQKRGLNTESIDTIEGETTGTASIFIDSKGENCIGLTAGANKHLTPAMLDQKSHQITSARVLLMQLEIPRESVLHSAMMAKKSAPENETLVILNPAPAPVSAEGLPEEIYPYIDILTPNKGELASLTAMPTDTNAELIDAAENLLDRGVKIVIVTLGKNGVLYVDKQHQEFIQAYPANAIDTTAAGDCFNGYLASAIATGPAAAESGQGLNTIKSHLKTAINYAMAAAALSVTREGAIPSIPEKHEVESVMRANEKARE